MTLNLDVSMFSIICELGDCLYQAETELHDMKLHRIIDDISKGQFENVKAVLEFNPVEGWCNDITDDVLNAVTALDEEPVRGNPANYSTERIDGKRAGVSVRVAA